MSRVLDRAVRLRLSGELAAQRAVFTDTRPERATCVLTFPTRRPVEGRRQGTTLAGSGQLGDSRTRWEVCETDADNDGGCRLEESRRGFVDRARLGLEHLQLLVEGGYRVNRHRSRFEQSPVAGRCLLAEVQHEHWSGDA